MLEGERCLDPFSPSHSWLLEVMPVGISLNPTSVCLRNIFVKLSASFCVKSTEAFVFYRTTCNIYPLRAPLWVAFVNRREMLIFKARLPHEKGWFILFACSARQLLGGDSICESSRKRDSFCDFIIDLPKCVMPCSGGSTFVLFALSVFQMWHLCSIEEGQVDWSAKREKRGNAKSLSC